MLTKLTETDLLKAIQLHGTGVIEHCLADSAFDQYIKIVDQEKLPYPVPRLKIDSCNWFVPNEYKNMDIEKFLVDQCPESNQSRLLDEIALFKKHNMVPVLTAMKYLVDTLRKHGIVWGVGRGSSVASYALFLIGVHKIDSVKYDLPIIEFFKGEKNGQTI